MIRSSPGKTFAAGTPSLTASEDILPSQTRAQTGPDCRSRPGMLICKEGKEITNLESQRATKQKQHNNHLTK